MTRRRAGFEIPSCDTPGRTGRRRCFFHRRHRCEFGRVDPACQSPDYVGTRLRAPLEPLIAIPGSLTERTARSTPRTAILPTDADLATRHAGDLIGERIVVPGRLLGATPRRCVGSWSRSGRPTPPVGTRTISTSTARPFTELLGQGRCLTVDHGRYRFTTVKPGARHRPNHPNAWRPNHIRFGLFGRAFTERLVTRVYFPGDPLLELDSIHGSIRDEQARAHRVAALGLTLTEPEWALGYRFDIVVGGRHATPEDPDDD